MFLLLCRNFLVWCSLSFIFALTAWTFGVKNQRIITKTNIKGFLLGVMVSILTIKTLIYLKLIFVGVIKQGSNSFFCTCISSFPDTIYWKNYPFPTEYSWLACQIPVNCICMGLLLDSQFYSIGLCVCFYAGTILFRSL